MVKYLVLIPLVGVFAPPYLEDWDSVCRDNPVLFTVSFIIQILSVFSMFVICS